MIVLIAQVRYSARSFGCGEYNFGCSCLPHIHIHSRGLGLWREGLGVKDAAMAVLIARSSNGIEFGTQFRL